MKIFECANNSKESSECTVIRYGIDPELDEKRNIHNSLPGFLTKISEEECERLPEELGSVCTASYIPQVL